MIRFLVLFCITVIVIALMGVVFITPFDTKIELAVYDYHIQTSIFVFVILLIILQCLLLLAIKLLSFLFSINAIIQDRLHRNKIQKNNRTLLQSIIELLMGKKQSALQIINKTLPNMIGNDIDNAHNLIFAETEMIFDKKVYYLRMLLDKRGYNLYATKKLTEIFYANKHYSEAENYGSKAFNLDDTDTDIMLMLIRIYAKLDNYSKMIFIVAKLQRANNKLLEESREEIAGYYLKGAKSLLESENDEESIKYLESALQLKPDFVDALALFLELNVNRKNTSLVAKLLQQAFSLNPSFDIALMYINASASSAKVAYEALSNIVDIKQHLSLFLSIATYLGLQKESSELVARIKGA